MPQADLRTVVAESGAAFKDAGPSLGQIIDTSSSFIDDGQGELRHHDGADPGLARGAADPGRQGLGDPQLPQNLALFSGTVAENDKYLRSLIDNGSATANELRTFLEQNKVNLGQLLNNLVTTNEIVVKHLKGIRQLLVIYPYVVAGGFTVAKKNGEGHYDARFGLILPQDVHVCKHGYEGTDRRRPRTRPTGR